MSTVAETKRPAAAARSIEIEQLLTWTFREELPKRELAATAAEVLWRDMEVSGPFGPVDEGTPVQRYAYVGAPHRDALAVEAAVAGLPLVVIDWDESLEAIMGELAGLVSINDLRRHEEERRVTRSSWTGIPAHLNGGKPAPAGASENRHRDVIMVGSVQTAELVRTHASRGTRPKWFSGQVTCHPTPSRDPSKALLVGSRGGRNLYSIGSHCPLTWRPSPITIAQCRADYIGWWRGLSMLAQSLELSEHVVLPPVAQRLPWFDAEAQVWLFGRSPPPKMSTLPLKHERPAAGPTRGQGEDIPRRHPVRRPASKPNP